MSGDTIAPEPQDNTLSEISELINPPEMPDSPETEQPAEAAQEVQPEPDEVAETPEDTEPEQEAPAIDYDLEVPMPDGGESQTIGQLKDFFQQHQEWQQERDDWADTRTSQENELLVARQQIVELSQLMGEVKPEVIQALAAQQQARIEQQRNLMMQSIPDWQDQEKMKADRARIVETAAEYGVTAQDIGLVNDHRFVKMLKDFADMKQRQARGQAALDKAAKPPKGQKVSGKVKEKPRTAQLVERAKAGNRDDQMAAISALIKEG